ncbi:MAG TPA: hypothetical protein VGO86_17585 [Candidatus Dormibacteraeota bacterium]
MAIGEREWDDPGQLDNLVRLFRSGRHEPASGPLRFFVGGPLQPGEPLQVSCLAQAPVEDGWVEVSVGGHLLDTLHLPDLVAGTAARVRPPAGTTGAKALYEIGTKRLTFKALGAHGAVCQQVTLTVTTPDVAGWWAWRWPEPQRSCYWRCAYRAGGELTNLGAAAVRVTRAAFEETGPDGASRWIEDVTLASPEVAAQSAASVLCRPVQSWEWASWGAPLGGEDYVRRFGYELHLNLEDEFGNRYRLRSRLPEPVPVLISPRKRNWWRAEAALRGAGIALLVRAASQPSDMATDLAYRIFGAGATRGRRGIADRIHDLVAGPPSPDREFGARVSWPRRLAVEEVVSGELSWADRVVVEAVIGLEFLVALHEAVAEAEGRWLGARLADDAEGMRNQRSDQLDLLRLTHEEWARASYRVAELRTGQPEGEDEVPYRLAEWQVAGVPTPIIEDWERQGVPARWIEDVLVAGGGLLWTAEGVLGYVRRSLEAALFATRDLLIANPEVGPTSDRA